MNACDEAVFIFLLPFPKKERSRGQVPLLSHPFIFLFTPVGEHGLYYFKKKQL
jgi:hypothetical protein